MLRGMNAPDPIPPRHRQPTEVRPAHTPDGASRHIDRLEVVVHELDNLLDGSLRSVNLASRTLSHTTGALGLHDLETVRRQLETASKALTRMAGIVHAAMKGDGFAQGGSIEDPNGGLTLREAVEHAAEVMSHAAGASHSTISLTIDGDVSECLAGSVYPAVLNAIRNALDSIEAAGGRGTVAIDCRREAKPRTPEPRNNPAEAEWIRIEIRDDGLGLPPDVPPGRLFVPGFTTKAHGRGIGLSLARSLLERMGGAADLITREARDNPHRPGALLTLRFPAASPPGVTPNRSRGESV
jgi:signal transduction histidine kinase